MVADYNSRMRFVLAVAAVALLSSGGVAHEKFKIVGTVAKVHAEQLDVKAVDGSTYEMDSGHHRMHQYPPALAGGSPA